MKATFSIIGSGNVAEALGLGLIHAGFVVKEVQSRNYRTAGSLAKKLSAKRIRRISELSADVDFILFAVPDDVIGDIAQTLPADCLAKSTLLHCSGACSSDVLHIAKTWGVFYPLQSFTKGRKIDLKQVPFCISSNSDKNSKQLLNIGKKIGASSQLMTDADRLQIHAMAVVVNNFPNHLYAQSQAFLKDSNLSFDLLHALIRETTDKALSMSPEAGQTGPAIRDDQSTIKRHIKQLKEYPQLRKIYQTITTSITNWYN